MEKETALSLRKCGWSARAEYLLGRSAHDALVGMATLRGMVEAGADLFTFDLGGEAVAAFVVTVNRLERGVEAVVVAAGADLPGVSLTSAIHEALLLTHGYVDRIRVSASRRGMERRLAALKYRRMAATYVLDL